MQLLILPVLFVFPSFVLSDFVDLIWTTAQRTTFPLRKSAQQSEILVMHSKTPIEIKQGSPLIVHSSDSLESSVVVKPEHKKSINMIKKLYLKPWSSSYTELEFKVRPTESSSDCSEHAVILTRSVETFDCGRRRTVGTRVVSREFDDSDLLRYTEHPDRYHYDTNWYILELEGPSRRGQCTFELIEAVKRYNKHELQHKINYPPKERRVYKVAVVKQKRVEQKMVRRQGIEESCLEKQKPATWFESQGTCIK